MNCGVGCRHRLDPALLWLWYRLAATAPIPPLSWELPLATSAALKRKKKIVGRHKTMYTKCLLLDIENISYNNNQCLLSHCLSHYRYNYYSYSQTRSSVADHMPQGGVFFTTTLCFIATNIITALFVLMHHSG